MKYNVKVESQKDFNNWINNVKSNNNYKMLDIPSYKKLQQKTINDPVSYYSGVTPNLFKKIMMQYKSSNMEL